MKNEDLDKALARRTRKSRAKARDEIDDLVQEILRKLRAGEPVDLPGLGKLVSAARKKKRRRSRKGS